MTSVWVLLTILLLDTNNNNKNISQILLNPTIYVSKSNFGSPVTLPISLLIRSPQSHIATSPYPILDNIYSLHLPTRLYICNAFYETRRLLPGIPLVVEVVEVSLSLQVTPIQYISPLSVKRPHGIMHAVLETEPGV